MGYMQQEIDRLELGEMSARCLKGENGERGEAIIIGRYRRGVREGQVEDLRRRFGKKLPWSDVIETDEEQLRREVARLDREKQAAIRSLTEYHERREAERRRLLRRIVAMEREKGRLKATIRILVDES